MIAAFSPFLAVRYLVTRRINLLGIAGVMFAVWAMLVVDAVFTGFVSGIQRDVHASSTDLLITDLPHDTGYEALCAAIEAERELVVATAPRLRHHGLLQRMQEPQQRGERPRRGSSQVDFDHTQHGFALLVGIDPVREEAVSGLRGWLVRGPAELAQKMPGLADLLLPSTVLDEPNPDRRSRLLAPDDVEWEARRRVGLPVEPDHRLHRSDWPGVLFGWRRFMQTSMLPKAEPFDLLVAAVGRDNTLRSDSTPCAFAGFFATGHRMFDENAVLLPIKTLRSLLGQDSFDPLAIDLVTDIAVRVRRDTSATALAAGKQRLQRAVQALLPPGSTPCSVLDWQQQNLVFLSAVAHEQAMMQFVLFVVMLVAAFVIYATLHMMVVQKVKDIGILAAIGGSPAGIGAVFLVGGLTVGATGALLGIGAGLLSVQYLNPVNDWLFANFNVELFPRALFDLREIPCDLEPSWIAKVGIGAVLLALFVAFVPSRKASRMNPVQALSYE